MANGLPASSPHVLKTPLAVLQRNEEYRKKNWDKVYERQLAWQRANKEKCNTANRKSRRKLRLEVLAAYGSQCDCCGEKEEAFLEVHHKNGGGNQHRRELGGGAKLYSWLKRLNWPADFGLLCSNCNKARYNRGYCPHELRSLGDKVDG